MPESNGNGRTQVLIAVIGLAGVLGAAIFANWEKIFPKPPVATPSRTSSPEAGANSGQDKHSKDNAKVAGKSSDASPKDPKNIKPREPDSVKPVPVPEKPKAYSIQGRLTDQLTGKVLCTGLVSAMVAGAHQVQRADSQGRYAFELEGFASDDQLVLSARVPNYQEYHLVKKLSELSQLENLGFARMPQAAAPKLGSGSSLGAKIGALAGGGKGAAASSTVNPAASGLAACADASGTVPAYEKRPDPSHLVKGAAGTNPSYP